MSTTEVGRLVGTTPGNLLAAIRNGKLDPPERDRWGRYVWGEADIERARAALLNDRRRKRPASRGGVPRGA